MPHHLPPLPPTHSLSLPLPCPVFHLPNAPMPPLISCSSPSHPCAEDYSFYTCWWISIGAENPIKMSLMSILVLSLDCVYKLTLMTQYK